MDQRQNHVSMVHNVAAVLQLHGMVLVVFFGYTVWYLECSLVTQYGTCSVLQLHSMVLVVFFGYTVWYLQCSLVTQYGTWSVISYDKRIVLLHQHFPEYGRSAQCGGFNYDDYCYVYCRFIVATSARREQYKRISGKVCWSWHQSVHLC